MSARPDKRRQFRLAADHVARRMAGVEAVQKAVLFGSVAHWPADRPARCRPHDVDLAVWLTSLGCLRELQLARSGGAHDVLVEHGIGVAHHQVDVFIMEPGTDRYLGGLCIFRECPRRDRYECLAPGCGATPLLRQHEGFVFAADALSPDRSVVLFERLAATGGTRGQATETPGGAAGRHAAGP